MKRRALVILLLLVLLVACDRPERETGKRKPLEKSLAAAAESVPKVKPVERTSKPKPLRFNLEVRVIRSEAFFMPDTQAVKKPQDQQPESPSAAVQDSNRDQAAEKGSSKTSGKKHRFQLGDPVQIVGRQGERLLIDSRVLGKGSIAFCDTDYALTLGAMKGRSGAIPPSERQTAKELYLDCWRQWSRDDSLGVVIARDKQLAKQPSDIGKKENGADLKLWWVLDILEQAKTADGVGAYLVRLRDKQKGWISARYLMKGGAEGWHFTQRRTTIQLFNPLPGESRLQDIWETDQAYSEPKALSLGQSSDQQGIAVDQLYAARTRNQLPWVAPIELRTMTIKQVLEYVEGTWYPANYRYPEMLPLTCQQLPSSLKLTRKGKMTLQVGQEHVELDSSGQEIVAEGLSRWLMIDPVTKQSTRMMDLSWIVWQENQISTQWGFDEYMQAEPPGLWVRMNEDERLLTETRLRKELGCPESDQEQD